MADGFGAGFNGPLVLAAEFPKGADTAALDRLADALRATPDVAAVIAADRSTPPGDARRHPRDPGELAAVAAHHRPRAARCATT